MKFLLIIAGIILLTLGGKSLKGTLKEYLNEFKNKKEEPTLFKVIDDFFLVGKDGFTFGILPIILGVICIVSSIIQF